MEYEHLAKKIIGLKNADLELRTRLVQNGQIGNGYNEEMEKLHNRNAAILEEIMGEIGYPTVAKVGGEASEAAWLVIQHAIGQPPFMKECARLLEEANGGNPATRRYLAYLTDRIAVFEDRPQLYGTQFDWDEHGELNPNAYDDFSKVNERRKAIGLNSLSEQIDVMRKQARDENQSAPADYRARKKEMAEWKKKVGWT